MHMANAVRRTLLAGLVSALACGCDERPVGPLPQTAAQESIVQLGRVLGGYRGKPAPKALKDILSREQGYPAAIGALRSKDVLLYWGVGLADGPDAAATVAAYGKDVPEKGGEVLMQDGTAKAMTADEFKAARKPPGAKTDPGPLPLPAKTR
ncbi:MAG TPA: hypothetical protein VGH33_21050 [Isosphaeraceae bacterium]